MALLRPMFLFFLAFLDDYFYFTPPLSTICPQACRGQHSYNGPSLEKKKVRRLMSRCGRKSFFLLFTKYHTKKTFESKFTQKFLAKDLSCCTFAIGLVKKEKRKETTHCATMPGQTFLAHSLSLSIYLRLPLVSPVSFRALSFAIVKSKYASDRKVQPFFLFQGICLPTALQRAHARPPTGPKAEEALQRRLRI